MVATRNSRQALRSSKRPGLLRSPARIVRPRSARRFSARGESPTRAGRQRPWPVAGKDVGLRAPARRQVELEGRAMRAAVDRTLAQVSPKEGRIWGTGL